MKKRFLQCLSLLLCAALLTLPALAAEGDASQIPDQGPIRVWGTLTRLDDGGLLVENSNENDPLNQVILRGESILCLDAVTGEPMDVAELKNGETIYAWVNSVMTLSLPPQTTAILILGNIPADYTVPQFYEISAVTPQAMIAIYPPPALTWTEVTATDGTVLKITDEAELTPYLTKNIVRLEDLVPGTRILVWKDMNGSVTKTMVFPYTYAGYVSWTEDGTVLVNGTVVERKARITEAGGALLPIRAVAEALGLSVRWNGTQGAVVSQNGQTLLAAMPGGQVLGPDGSSLGGTCVKEAGVTYLSAAVLLQALNLFQAG